MILAFFSGSSFYLVPEQGSRLKSYPGRKQGKGSGYLKLGFHGVSAKSFQQNWLRKIISVVKENNHIIWVCIIKM
ncbi:hypothetical protein RchiOBHm_Chr2g0116261 [Rosa chinensis]|uniref:Uncharacterized protein n=1 Tax=Rosa chinensis TaxID=74649 RepID=A0A2P6RR71_ROSCH|nr:hypothetical protein RchiOBHm_Chr2g0116261 [Rosa chinensis]